MLSEEKTRFSGKFPKIPIMGPRERIRDALREKTRLSGKNSQKIPIIGPRERITTFIFDN